MVHSTIEVSHYMGYFPDITVTQFCGVELSVAMKL